MSLQEECVRLTVQFILGRSGTDKSEWMMNDIENRLQKEPLWTGYFLHCSGSNDISIRNLFI